MSTPAAPTAPANGHGRLRISGDCGVGAETFNVEPSAAALEAAGCEDEGAVGVSEVLEHAIATASIAYRPHRTIGRIHASRITA